MKECMCAQGTRQALEVQVRALEERVRKQRSARQQLEEHLKGLFRDFQAARGTADALRQRCAAGDDEKAALRARLQECEHSLISLQVWAPPAPWELSPADAALEQEPWQERIPKLSESGVHGAAHGHRVEFEISYQTKCKRHVL